MVETLAHELVTTESCKQYRHHIPYRIKRRTHLTVVALPGLLQCSLGRTSKSEKREDQNLLNRETPSLRHILNNV